MLVRSLVLDVHAITFLAQDGSRIIRADALERTRPIYLFRISTPTLPVVGDMCNCL